MSIGKLLAFISQAAPASPGYLTINPTNKAGLAVFFLKHLEDCKIDIVYCWSWKGKNENKISRLTTH